VEMPTRNAKENRRGRCRTENSSGLQSAPWESVPGMVPPTPQELASRQVVSAHDTDTHGGTLPHSQPAKQQQDRKEDLRAEVYCLRAAKNGWKRHDERLIILTCSHLIIYDKGSTSRAKLVVSVLNDLLEVSAMGNGMMSIQTNVQKKRQPSCCSAGSVTTRKIYFFEFKEKDLANTFVQEISNLQSLPPLRKEGQEDSL